MSIQLPSLSWFWQIQDNRPVKNILTGSLGTDPAKGCLHLTTFNYKVYADDTDEDNKKLVAEYHAQLPWSQKLRRTEVTSRVFDYSLDGLKEIQSWLETESESVLDANRSQEG